MATLQMNLSVWCKSLVIIKHLYLQVRLTTNDFSQSRAANKLALKTGVKR